VLIPIRVYYDTICLDLLRKFGVLVVIACRVYVSTRNVHGTAICVTELSK